MLSCTDLIHQLDGIINNILKTGEVTPAIQAPLAQLIERIKAFGITGAIKGRDIPEFYYYHATRVLRLLFIKAQRRFSQARERLENPRVAKDFQALLPNIAELCTAIEILAPQKDNREENAMIIENLTDHLYEEALDRDFMFTPEEEMKIDEISVETLKDVISLVK